MSFSRLLRWTSAPFAFLACFVSPAGDLPSRLVHGGDGALAYSGRRALLLRLAVPLIVLILWVPTVFVCPTWPVAVCDFGG